MAVALQRRKVLPFDSLVLDQVHLREGSLNFHMAQNEMTRGRNGRKPVQLALKKG
jgi:hypothetical protein